MLVHDIGKRSSFEYEPFEDGYYTYLAINAKKYPEHEAIGIAAYELDLKPEEIKTARGYVYYGFGVDDEGCKRNGWWLSRVKKSRSIEVLVCGEENAMKCY